MKIVIIGAGSVIFTRNIVGDCLCTDVLRESEFALYDINKESLEEAKVITEGINRSCNNSMAKISIFCGETNRKEALRGADFVFITIRVGGFRPHSEIDLTLPEKAGVQQTVGDTLGIGGIMRGLRTIPVFEEIYNDMEAVCPHAIVLNYTNPMAIVTGYVQRFTHIKTIGLCHSVQVCSENLLKDLGMEDKLQGRRELIAGINHMAWLLSIKDRDGNDLYPEIREKAIAKNLSGKHDDMVRYDYIRYLGYYCTESSRHNAEYSALFMKSWKPQESINHYNIPVNSSLYVWPDIQKKWIQERDELLSGKEINHDRSKEYASYILETIVKGGIYKIGANVINHGMISNLPYEACVEVPTMVDGYGFHPSYVGALPEQCAGMNRLDINVQLMTIEAARTRKKEDIYRAAMLDPHTAAELTPDEIVNLCDKLIEAHGTYMSMYK